MATIGTAIVTGASSGIGAVYADRLARRGYDLVLVARDVARLEAAADALQASTGCRAEVMATDLTDRPQLARVTHRLANDPDITLLVNNAGMSLNGSWLAATPGEVEQLIALNVTAPTLLAKAAATVFASRGHGAVINVSSVLALAPEAVDGAYSGSKAHLLNLTLAIAAKLGGQGVYTQAVLPGATRTEIFARSGKDLDSLMPPELIMDAGDLVDAALAGFDRGETVTIPSLQDPGAFEAYDAARRALTPHLHNRLVAERYRVAREADPASPA